MKALALVLLGLMLGACAPAKDPTTFMGVAPQATPTPSGPGVSLQWRRQGDLLPAVLNAWVEDAGGADVVTLSTYDTNAWSYSTNPYSIFMVGCPCGGDPLAFEMAAYWPRFWAKSNTGALVDAASHATSTYSSDATVSLFWDWKDRSGVLVPSGTYTLWVEYSSYVYGGSAAQAPTAHVAVVRNGSAGSAVGVVDQGTAVQSIGAGWLP